MKGKLVLATLALMLMLGACATDPQAGRLPPKWWEMDRGQIQNYYRSGAQGPEKTVVMFVGISDSLTNKTESTAIENARMDAFQQLSRYMSQKVTGVQQASQHVNVLQQAVANGEMGQETCDQLSEQIEEKFANFSASVTSTQFSSFKEEGTHVEESDDRYKAWVCYSMSDQVLEETRELQRVAFESLMEETEEYKEIMQRIQEVIAQQMEENIMSETTL